ncbi:MAG: hypothetical protein KBD05_03215 [Candidatus Pacebacteria bacterium]|nr:hypothetical protein [Candidatus Paceibacterota bacterium]
MDRDPFQKHFQPEERASDWLNPKINFSEKDEATYARMLENLELDLAAIEDDSFLEGVLASLVSRANIEKALGNEQAIIRIGELTGFVMDLLGVDGI